MASSTIKYCTPFTLPSHGILALGPSSTVTLASDVLFTPECSQLPDATSAWDEAHGVSSIVNVKDPFYASVTPQIYATGAVTVIAWMLVFMLLITPRTFFVGGANGGYGLLGRRGVISGAQGGASVIGVGSRPWLQKVAALTAAIGMTIVTVDMFKCAQQQYMNGFMDAVAMRVAIESSINFKATRIVSYIFLWLAMVQTLIRLFPRHKEKVLIKWIGFALIILDATFSSLNSFLGNSLDRPKEFRGAIPALSYAFQLALGMLYSAWVIYYAIVKRRFSFYHSDMWNISLVAFLSFVALFTPVVFFVTDISNERVAAWGDYFRWVGMAAASVIVWEWVERIEALERDEKKDGILGREMFDGDEMLEVTAIDEIHWPRNRRWFQAGLRRRGDGYDDPGGGLAIQKPNHPPPRQNETRPTSLGRSVSEPRPTSTGAFVPIPTQPPTAASPVSRADTSSAGSTVYTIRYHTINLPTTPEIKAVEEQPASSQQATALLSQTRISEADEPPNAATLTSKQPTPTSKQPTPTSKQPTHDDPSSHPSHFTNISNPFKRRRAAPPAEVQRGQVIEPVPIPSASRAMTPVHNYSRWNIKGRLGAFAAEHGERFMEWHAKRTEEADLPLTIIPAQPRGGMPSPALGSPAASSRARSEGASGAGNEDEAEGKASSENEAPSVILEARRESPAGSETVLVIPAPLRTPSAGSSRLGVGDSTPKRGS